LSTSGELSGGQRILFASETSWDSGAFRVTRSGKPEQQPENWPDETVRSMTTRSPLRSLSAIAETCFDPDHRRQQYLLPWREEELCALDGALLDTHAGNDSVVVVVTGPVGSGKSTLLRAHAKRAVTAGAYVLSTSALAAGSGRRTDLVDQLLLGLPADVLTPGGPGQLRPHDLASIGDDRVETLGTLLRQISAERPVVLTIDDLDSDSAQEVGQVVAMLRATAAHALLVVAESDTSQDGSAAHSPMPRSLDYDRVITLQPLSRQVVSGILAEQAGLLPTAQMMERSYALTGGRPLLFDALLRDVMTITVPGSSQPTPGPHFARAVLQCLYADGPHVVATGRALAVLGVNTRPEILAALTGCGLAEVDKALAYLAEVGLLDGTEFRHSSMRRAVINDIPALERDALHEVAVRLLYEDGAAAKVVAEHLAMIQRVDEPWGIHVLREASRCTLREGDTVFAIACLKLAQRFATDEDEWLRLTAELATAQWNVNPTAAHRQLSALLEAFRANRVDQDAVCYAGWLLLWAGRVEECRELIGMVAERLPERSEFLTAWLACLYPAEHGSAGAEPVAAPRPSALAADGIAAWCAGTGPLPPHHSSTAHVMQQTAALLALAQGTPPETVASWRSTASRHSPEIEGAEIAHVMEMVCRAVTELQQGEMRSAADLAVAALAEFPHERWGVVLGAPLAVALRALTAMGRYEEAGATCLSRTLPEAAYQTPFGLLYLEARGGYYLSTANHEAALRDFERCGEQTAAWPSWAIKGLAWRLGAAEALLQLGQDVEARHHLERQFAAFGPGEARLRGMALRVRATAEAPHSRPPILKKAAALLTEADDKYELARALADLTESHRALGDWNSARVVQAKAMQLAEQCGAAPLRDRLTVRSGLPTVDEHSAMPPELSSLSKSERRVAALASQGYTNQQIAKNLFITESTVEQHLTRTFRKLRVRRRDNLPLSLAWNEG
jgi:DNA-binding CsgD family transcriptional regulator